MDARETFKEIFAADGKEGALRLEIRRDELEIDLHATGNVTLWWKGKPIEFVPLIVKCGLAACLATTERNPTAMPRILEMKELNGKLAVFLDMPPDEASPVHLYTDAEFDAAIAIEREACAELADLSSHPCECANVIRQRTTT